MKTVKKTYGDLLVLVQLLNATVKDGKTIGEKKLAIIGKKIQKHLDEYNEKLEDIRLDNASVDENKNLILGKDGGYLYTADASKKITKALKELVSEEFDFELIEIFRPSGLETYTFLNGWVTGMEFEVIEQEEIEL